MPNSQKIKFYLRFGIKNLKFAIRNVMRKKERFLKGEFCEDCLVAILKFLIRRNPISPFYAFWKTLFVAKEWKFFGKYFRKFDRQFWMQHPFISALGSFIFLTLIIGGVFYFTFNKVEDAAAWWNDSWEYRKVLEINHTKVAGNLTDFPVLISMTDADFVTKAQTDGDDFVFTASIGGTKLAHEIESYDSGTGTLVAWVKVPSLSSNKDTNLYMYYGNATSASQQDVENVWSDDYQGVWHLSEASGGRLDSTSKDNDLSDVGAVAQDDGAFGGYAAHFDNTQNEYLEIINDDLSADFPGKVASTAFTLSTWVSFDSFPSSHSHNLIFKGGTAYMYHTDSDDLIHSASLGNYVSQTPISTIDTWYLLTLTYDGSDIRFYLNGQLDSNAFTLASLPTSSSSFRVGNRWDFRTDRKIDGLMDEVKISNALKSEAWIETEFNNQNDPASFFTTSAEQAGPGNPVGYWSFDNGYDIIAYDESLTDNDGTLTSGPTWQSEDMCVGEKCLSFDGSDDRVIIPANIAYDFDINASFSVFTWFKKVGECDSVGTGSNEVFISRFGNGHADETWWFGCQGIGDADANKLTINMYPGSGTGVALNSTVTINDDKWHYGGFVYDDSSNELKLYIDGVENNSMATSFGTGFTSSYPLCIGDYDADCSNSFDYHGFMDEVRIYPYARTSNQVKQDYNAGTAGAGTNTGTSVSFGGKSDKWMSSGLVGYWKMDEASWDGTADEVEDVSGNGNDGTAAGGVTTDNGKFGSGGDFDRTDDYIGMGNVLDFERTEPFSISTWVKRDATGVRQTIVSKRLSSSTYRGYYLTLESGNDVNFLLTSNGTSNSLGVKSNQTITDTSQWHNISMTYDGSSAVSGMKLYIDGEEDTLVRYDSLTDTTITSANFNIGSRNDGVDKWGGGIDEVRIYNRELSEIEITDLYEYAPGPVLDLKMDEKEGTVVYDQSGYSNNATLYNSPTWSVGKYNSGIHLAAGTIDYLETPKDASLDFSKAAGITLESWVYLESTSDGHSIMSGWDGDVNMSGSVYWGLDNQSSQGYSINNMIDGASDSHTVSTTWDLNRWYFLSYTYDGAEEILYRDGKVMGSWDRTGDIDYENEVGIMIGTSVQRTRDFGDGRIDDVKIYNYARDREQILEDMYNGGSAAKHSSLNLAFDEGYGVVTYDESGQENNGTIVGASWQNKSMCVAEKCLSYNGTSDKVDISSSPELKIDSQLTITVWVRLHQKASELGRDIGIVFKNNSYGLEIESDTDCIDFAIWDGGVSEYQPAACELLTNKWYFLTSVFDGDKMKLYLDGDLLGTQDVSADSIDINDIDLTIGYSHSGRYLDGEIDEVKVFSYARSADSLRQDYNAGTAGIKTNTGTGISIGGQSDRWKTEGLKGYWKMNEGSWDGTAGEVVDASGNGNDGTAAGGVTTSSGKYGKAGDFDGTDDYVDLNGNFGFGSSTPFTLEAWIKPAVGITNNDYQVFGRFNGSKALQFGITWAGGADYKLYSAYGDTGGDIVAFPGSTVLRLGQWQHMVLTYDGSQNGKIFLNGKLDGSTNSAPSDFADSTEMHIGNRGGDNAEDFEGAIDNARVYNRVLSETEIEKLYLESADPILHLKMDEMSGTTTYDSSGADNDGTIEGATWESVGRLNSALSFDGSNDYVQLGDDIFSSLGQGTISGWIKIDDLSGIRTFFATQATSGSSGELFWIVILMDGSLEIRQRNVEGTTDNILATLPAGTFSSNNWYHLNWVVDENGNKFYLNGEKKTLSYASGSSSNNFFFDDIPTTQRYWLGARRFQGSLALWHKGELDDIKIYNHALSSREITKNYNGGKPIAHWKMDKGADTTVYDWSGNGNNGTMIDMDTATDWVDGKMGEALNFDGDNDYVDFGSDDILFDSTEPATISFWIYLESGGLPGAMSLMTDQATGFMVFFNNSSYDGINFGSNSNFDQFKSVDNFYPTMLNSWHHIVIVFDGDDRADINSYQLYFDSKSATLELPGFFDVVPNQNRLGIAAGGDTNLDGSLDDVKIYNYALTMDEIEREFNGGAAMNFK